MKKIRELSNRRDWRPMNKGLIPIKAPSNNLSVRADFAGQGNEHLGVSQAGSEVRIAADNDPLAVVTYTKNFDQESVCVDLTAAPASYFGGADIYVATASCQAQSGASGKAHEPDQQGFWGDGTTLEAQRDRALMNEIVSTTANQLLVSMKPFGYVVAENVVESVIKWRLFPRWVQGMNALGYHVQVLNLNSRFAHGNDSLAEGENRDRVYLICTYRGDIKKYRMPIPDLDKIRPPAWCPAEEKPVNARQFWKETKLTRNFPRDMRAGKYGEQYIYCCENCGKRALPLSLNAGDHLDKSLPMVRVSDRPSLGLPIFKEASEDRIKNGIAKWVLPVLASGGSHSSTGLEALSLLYNGATPLDLSGSHADAVSDLLANGNQRIWDRYSKSGSQLGSQQETIGFIVPYYSNSTPTSLDAPIGALTTRDRFLYVEIDAEALATFEPRPGQTYFTAADVPDAMFQGAKTRWLSADEGSVLMGEPYGQIAMSDNHSARVDLTGRSNSVKAIRLVFEELLYAQYPEVRPVDRIPNVQRIIAHHLEQIMSLLERGEQVVSMAGDTSTPLLVPSEELFKSETTAIDSAAQRARKTELRQAAKLRRENDVVSVRARQPKVELDEVTGLVDLSSLRKNPKEAQLGFDF